MKLRSTEYGIIITIFVTLLAVLFYIDILTDAEVTTLYNYLLIVFNISMVLIFILVHKKFCWNFSNGITIIYMIYASCVTLFHKGSFSEVCDVMAWPLIFCTFTTVASNRSFDYEKYYKRLMVVFFPLYLFGAILVLRHVQGIIESTSDMFPAYVLLAVVPLILLSFNTYTSKIRKIYIIASLVILLLTSKRSELLAIILGVVGYYLTDILIARKNLNTKTVKLIKYVLCGLLLAVIGYEALVALGFDVFQRMGEILDNGGNGRIYIWTTVIDTFKNSRIIDKIFGHGYHSVRFFMFNGNLAHNDFLNILYDYGIIGVALYLIFILDKIIQYVKLVNMKSYIAKSYAFSLAITIMMAMVSYFGIQSRIINFVVIYWALVNSSIIQRGKYEKA